LTKSHHLAIWDDHDAGPNDCDLSTFSGFSTTMKAFKDFWDPDYPQPNTNSYYGQTSAAEGLVDIYLLDNRSFRTHKDSANATVFGVEQLNWFRSTLGQSTAKVHIICMGGQLLNTAQVFENMSNYPEERALLLQWLSKSPGKPIVLTGDRHSGEINEVMIDGKSIIEVCASPLTANAHPHDDENNSTRMHAKTTDTQHFGVLQLKLLDAHQVLLQTGLYDSNGTALFSHRETL
jgi:alkaline phosphatase D